MKITESQLRKFIRDVIQETRAFEDEELLKIGGDFHRSGTTMDRYDRVPYSYSTQENEKVMQLFKAWCYKNDLGLMDEEEIVDYFFRDYPYLKKSSSKKFRKDLEAHAKHLSSFDNNPNKNNILHVPFNRGN